MRSGLYLAVTLPFLLAMAVNAYGLTTFGKSNSVNPQAPQPHPNANVPKGRECQLEADCSQIQNTSCVPDPSEGKVSRCLCGDNTGPVNGVCKTKLKGPNHICNTNEDCAEGSQCMKYKEPGLRGVDKVCKCSEGYHFDNIDNMCSGGKSFKSGISAILSVSFVILTRMMTN